MYKLLSGLCLFLSLSLRAEKYYLFIGTYTHGTESKGIYVYTFDDSTGTLQWVSNTEKGSVNNPSYLALSPDGKCLYACTDTHMESEGSVSVFSIDKGRLSCINKQSSGGANPVYVSMDQTGHWLVNANYTAGNLSVFSINEDKSIGPARQIIQHSGSSINRERQEKAHVHAAVFSPQQNYILAPDLGADKIFCYSFDATREKPLQPASVPFINTTPGSGPRHFTFHPDGRYAYCIEELGGAVTAYGYANGRLDSIQRIKCYRKKEGEYNSSDIHISRDGRYLYASNRNRENNISIFAIDTNTGKLSLAGYENTGGREPRNFTITPSGNFLIVANQITGNVIVFKRDKQTGLLKRTSNEIQIPEPSCLQLGLFSASL